MDIFLVGFQAISVEKSLELGLGWFTLRSASTIRSRVNVSAKCSKDPSSVQQLCP